MRESFIFYKSFYESIKELDAEHQVEIYNAIFKHQFEGIETDLKGISKSIFTLIIPQLEANNKRWENGKKGGRPKNQKKTEIKPNENQTITKVKANVNDNVNVNENDNDNVNVNIFDYIESNFGRTLNAIEYEEINSWEDNELTRYAIKQAVLNGAYNIKYISKILFNYKKNSIITVQQAQQEEKKFKGEQDVPEWFDKEIKGDDASEESKEFARKYYGYSGE